MKLSYNWIKDYADIKEGPEALAEKLTMSGSEVGSCSKVKGDTVMELEITSNRPDCLNMIGLAREAAAVAGAKISIPFPKDLPKEGKARLSVRCDIKAPELCPRYTARIIEGVNVKDIAGKISDRLEALGMRKVNNVVDITNFCLMETGQPLHAFDLDKIKGARVEVRTARKGEKIVTIDGEERELAENMLVIADAERPIAVAGVMGGKDTEVTGNTRNILLESAYFDPVSVRRTSRALGISTDSSYRFERGVDKGWVIKASARAAGLILEHAGGIPGEIYDSGSYGGDEKEIEIDTARAAAVLGLPLDGETAKRILESLGMGVSVLSGGKMKVKVPSFREDVSREIDIIEEIARIYGYHRISETVPVPAPWRERKTRDRMALEKVKRLLAAMGLNEIMTYSMISQKAAYNFPELVKNEVRIKNPLSAEQEMLTPHLVDGMMKAMVWNLNRGNRDLMLFESGKRYTRNQDGTGFAEKPVLCVGMTGLASRSWAEGERKADIYRLKGVIENLAEHLRVGICFEPRETDGFTNAAAILAQGTQTGFIGEVAAEKLGVYGINQRVFVAEIELTEFLGKAVLKGAYSPVPRFPFSSRDVSVLCEKKTRAADIKEVITESAKGLAREVEITDMYEGKQIPDGKKSVSFRITYGVADRTLTDQEVEAAHSAVKSELSVKLAVSFR